MRSLGRLSDVAGSRVIDPDAPESENERITALERRVSTLELLLNDVMHQLDKPSQTSTPTKTSASTPQRKNKPKPQQPSPQRKNKPSPEKKQPQKQPWDDPQRLAEISELADRILSDISSDGLTKAETVERFQVDSKLAGQTLAWLVATGKMKMQTPAPTQDNPDAKNVFSLKSG